MTFRYHKSDLEDGRIDDLEKATHLEPLEL